VKDASLNYSLLQLVIKLSENLKGRNHLGNLVVDGRIILKLILWKYGGRVWTGFIWLRIRTGGGFL
jgi:hypothetical protein